MGHDPADEPPIDLSLTHYMEDQALAIAWDKAATAQQRTKVEALRQRQATLMEHRAAHTLLATARRHARGEVYSKARVAAINAMGPSRESMDDSIKALYLRQPDSESVLKAHALTHFTTALVSQRLGMALVPADIAHEARDMLAHEEAFATAWMAAIDDANFMPEIRERRREALAMFRTASRPMHLVTVPEADNLDDEDAAALGKAWNKLDALSSSLGVKPLSSFIAFEDEGDSAGMPASELLPTIEALLIAVASPAEKFPSRKKALSILGQVRDALQALDSRGGRAFFSVDL